MKKLFALLLAAILVIGLLGCSGKQAEDTDAAAVYVQNTSLDRSSTRLLGSDKSAALLKLIGQNRWEDSACDGTLGNAYCSGCGIYTKYDGPHWVHDVQIETPDEYLYYCSACGTFSSYDEHHSMTLTDKERKQVDAILSEYITLGLVVADTAYDWGITLTAVDVTPTGLTIRCTQSGGEVTGILETGSYYVVERFVDGIWVPLKVVFEGNYSWTLEAWAVPEDDTVEWQVNWERLYGSLPGGIYRIGKEFMDFRAGGNYDTMMIYAEFGIAENE